MDEGRPVKPFLRQNALAAFQKARDAEMPQMLASAYSSSTCAPTAMEMGMVASDSDVALANLQRLNQQAFQKRQFEAQLAQLPKPKQENIDMAAPSRRLVQVFLADPDPNVPLDHALLHSGEQKLTDLDDNELYFEIDVAGLLKAHNDYRVTLVDKRIKDRTVNLEPARIRDLRMTVVTIAGF